MADPLIFSFSSSHLNSSPFHLLAISIYSSSFSDGGLEVCGEFVIRVVDGGASIYSRLLWPGSEGRGGGVTGHNN